MDKKHISLNVLVDKEKNKVVFAECESDFVDVLLSFLTIPMGKIVSFARKQSPTLGIESLHNLYQSVDNLDENYFNTKVCKPMLLNPRSAAESDLVKLKLKLVNFADVSYHRCSSSTCIASKHKQLSYYENYMCKCGNSMDCQIKLLSENDHSVFLKGNERFLVSDDLKVMPSSTEASLSMFAQLGIKDMSKIEIQTFYVGVNEVLSLLICSLVSNTPLTEVLLKHKPESSFDLSKVYPFILGRYELKNYVDTKNEAITILKLFVSKSKNKVCYAEVKDDFVNLLFSFLTVPLGHALKNIQLSHPQIGCFNLYKSANHLDKSLFKSNVQREMLLDPKLALGFGCGNDLLGIQVTPDVSYYYACDHHVPKFSWQKYSSSDSHVNTEKIISCHNSAGFTYPSSMTVMKRYSEGKGDNDGYLRGPASFTMTDNLKITPISSTLGLSAIKDMNVPLSDIEGKIVLLSKNEVMRLLIASLVSDSALTSAFVRNPSIEDARSLYRNKLDERPCSFMLK